MNNLTKNEKTLLGLAGAIVILGGGYVLFQMPGAGSPGETATTTLSLPTTTPVGPAKQVVKAPPAPVAPAPASTWPSKDDIAAFNVKVNTSNAYVGSSLPQILISLPQHVEGKVIVITLKPSPSSDTVPAGILLTMPAGTGNDTHSISGLRLTDLTDGVTGKKFEVTPGVYVIETSLWDHSPFTTGGIYGSIAGNSAITVRSSPFAVRPAK